MAKKKTKEKIEKQQGKTLFDHLHQITQVQDTNYPDTLTELDKKTFSNYMIQRFLSMNQDWVEFISEMDPYIIGGQMKPEMAYKLYISMIPKSKIFLKYIKSTKSKDHSDKLVDLMKLDYQLPKSECIVYLDILNVIDPEHTEITSLLQRYGTEEKDIKKILTGKL